MGNKKTKLIDKNSLVITLERLTPNELFYIGKEIVKNSNYTIDDMTLRLISVKCQGDIRNLYQKLNPHFIENKNWEVLSSKDIQKKALPLLEKYINPKINLTIDNYQDLYFS